MRRPLRSAHTGPILALIRHAEPRPVADKPAAEWVLSTEGRERCAVLAKRLSRLSLNRIVTSTEPKALETGALVGAKLRLPVETANGLQEHERRSTQLSSSHDAFVDAVAEAMRRPTEVVLGEESADAAHERFAGALRAVIRSHPEERLGVVAHGMVIALLVSRASLVDPLSLWRRLGLPSVVVVVPPSYDLIEVIYEV
jgi:broad specificity phosphatase PhoE